MTLEQWAYISEIAAAIAVVATLLYVARQLKQNSDAILAGSRHAIVSHDLELLSSVLEHPSIYGALYKDGPLTSDEIHRLEAYLISIARTREHQWLQYKDGLLDKQTWESYRKGLTENLSFPRTREWWKRVSHHYFDDGFVDSVDEYLKTVPVLEGFQPALYQIQKEVD